MTSLEQAPPQVSRGSPWLLGSELPLKFSLQQNSVQQSKGDACEGGQPGTSFYYLVTRLMTVTDLLPVVTTRLMHAARNKLLRACYNNLLREDEPDLLGDCSFINLDNHWFQTYQPRGTTVQLKNQFDNGLFSDYLAT